MLFQPYAAKAIVQHEYTSNYLNIWVTFALPMNQDKTPALSTWLIDADSTVYDSVSQTWQDAYTLLIVSDTIATRPARVLLKYDGPDDGLETTWKKNWEPWGYILSTDITGTYLPTGTILLWSGTIATIPSGFALCDGNNGTPNLTNKFIVCADADDSGVAKSTIQDGTALQTGGTKDHLHAVSALVTGTTGQSPNFQQVQSGTGVYTSTPGHTHSFSASFAVDSAQQKRTAGGTNGEDLVPPFFALAYIMKL